MTRSSDAGEVEPAAPLSPVKHSTTDLMHARLLFFDLLNQLLGQEIFWVGPGYKIFCEKTTN